jgi:hypothetical protein
VPGHHAKVARHCRHQNQVHLRGQAEGESEGLVGKGRVVPGRQGEWARAPDPRRAARGSAGRCTLAAALMRRWSLVDPGRCLGREAAARLLVLADVAVGHEEVEVQLVGDARLLLLVLLGEIIARELGGREGALERGELLKEFLREGRGGQVRFGAARSLPGPLPMPPARDPARCPARRAPPCSVAAPLASPRCYCIRSCRRPSATGCDSRASALHTTPWWLAG